MRLALTALLALAFSATASARTAPEPPGYRSLEAAVAESRGIWRWQDRPRSIRAPSLRLTCVAAEGAFRISHISPWSEGRGSCAYRGPDDDVAPLMIFVSVEPRSRSPQEEARGAMMSMPAGMNLRSEREARQRNLGRCEGVLVHFTFPPASGAFSNGRAWNFQGRQEISYHLRSGIRSLEVTLVDHSAPHDNHETAVTALAEASGVC